MVSLSRRRFFTLMGASAAGALAVSPLEAFLAKRAFGQSALASPFGALSPKLPTTLDPRGTSVVNLRSAGALLEVPEGFEYCAFHVSGMRMSDRNPCPSDHDGMACFPGPRRDTYILVQNHELSPGEDDGSGFTGGTGLRKAYDKFDGDGGPGIGAGGCSNIIVSADGRVLRDYVSLAGTIRNCAGGPTPWGTWISCEENTTVPADNPAVTQKHGYNFEVRARGGLANPVPLIDMGRFNHEAVCVDPETGYVYETEDRGDSSIYRFRPNVSGNLKQGGVLEALVIEGGPQDTRTGVLGSKGDPLPVKWVKLDDVDPAEDTLRFEAQEKGAAIFARGEGAWFGNGTAYFVCTSGGDQGNGQVWAYDDSSKTITLVVESTDATELDNPDNITVSPVDGSLYLMEDGGGEQFIVGVTPSGDLFKLVRNNINESEFAGGCFSADGTKMFFNIQTPGITFMLYRTDGQPIVAG